MEFSKGCLNLPLVLVDALRDLIFFLKSQEVLLVRAPIRYVYGNCCLEPTKGYRTL